jgi:hypothetical protein
VYRTALDEGIEHLLVSSNSYEESLYLTAKFRLKFMLGVLLRSPVWSWPGTAWYLAAAVYHLMRLKLEYYLPPIGNLLSREPRRPETLSQINITDYVRWDVDHMVETLEAEAGWKAPRHPQLPMRFDCILDDSLMSQTYLSAVGMTDHGIMCNNLIYDGVRSKSQLQESYEFHNDREVTAKKVRQVMTDLGVK